MPIDRVDPDDYYMVGLKLVKRVLCQGPVGRKRPIHDTAIRLSLRCYHIDISSGHDDPDYYRDEAAAAMEEAETREEIWRALHWFWTDAQPD